MKHPALLIVAGLSATGKSTLASSLATRFALPLIQKDIIKEALCDVLDCTDVEQSRQYGHASMILLYQFAEVLLKCGQSCIIESIFYPQFAVPDLFQLQQRCPFVPLQIYCRTEETIRLQRFQQRVQSGNRHPGHFDQQRELQGPIPQEYLQPLPLGEHVIELDTTNFSTIDYERFYAQVQYFLQYAVLP